MLVEVWRVRIIYRNACRMLVQVRIVGFDYSERCNKLLIRESVLNAEMRVGCHFEVWRVGFFPENRVGWLWKFGKSVFTTAKHVGSFWKFGDRFDCRKAY